MQPLLTLKVHEAMRAAARSGAQRLACSLDLDRCGTEVEINATDWSWSGRSFPYLEACKDRTIYYWTGAQFQAASRFAGSLYKLVPTEWGPPTFEIDGIKMLPTASVSPYVDAERKVGWIRPRDKIVLDTCGGLGYFAAWCLQGQARQVLSYEKSAEVLWLRSLNPWSPENSHARAPGQSASCVAAEQGDRRLTLTHGDITERIRELAGGSVDAALHDPPRFGIAGELYSQVFYDQLARVLKRRGLLFHYTGTPNKLTSGRDVPNEVAQRLQRAGFTTRIRGDGVLATKK